MLYCFSTVPLPKDVSYFKKERKQVIERLLNVGEAKPLTIQAEILKEEVYNCLKNEYTTESLPLLLHDVCISPIYVILYCTCILTLVYV